MEAQTKDEIEKIMSEIEDLRKEISSTAPAEMSTASDVADAGHGAEADDVSLDALDEILSAEDLESASDDEALLQEFRAAEGDEPSMESTLAEMGEDAPEEGQSLLDQTLDDLGELEDEAADFDAASLDASLDALEAETFPEEERAVASAAKPTPIRTAPSRSPAMSSGEGSLTLQVSGSMTLRLQYDDDSHAIEVELAQDGLVIRMQDGAEFRIPTKKAA